MNDLFLKLKEIKLSRKNIILLFSGFAAVVFILLSADSAQTSEAALSENSPAYSIEYTHKLEKSLEETLEKIYGAGRVSVMITLESCYENVYAKAVSSKRGQEEGLSEIEEEEEFVIVKKGSNNEESLVIKVYEPVVRGVAVVAEGADKASVKNAIIQTVCALFDINTTAVSVEKMKN